MCFYTDYDWYAEEATTTTSEAGKPCWCQECGKPLTIWDWRKVIDMKEHAVCQICEDEWSDDYIDRVEMQQLLSSAAGDDPIFDNPSDVFEVHTIYARVPSGYSRCDIQRVRDGRLSRDWYTMRFIKVGSSVLTTQTRRLTVRAVNSE